MAVVGIPLVVLGAYHGGWRRGWAWALGGYAFAMSFGLVLDLVVTHNKEKISFFDFAREMLAGPLSDDPFDWGLDFHAPLSDAQQGALIEAAPGMARAVFFLWLLNHHTKPGNSPLRQEEIGRQLGFQVTRALEAAYREEGLTGADLIERVERYQNSIEGYFASLDVSGDTISQLHPYVFFCSHFADVTVPVDANMRDEDQAAHMAATQFALRVATQVEDVLNNRLKQVQIVADL